MPTDADPVVGNWYHHLDKGQRFEVVALDEAARVVEIQHFDGDVEEMDLDAWFEQDVELIETPEDWTGPFDEVEADNLDYTETDMGDEDWKAPYNELDRDDSTGSHHRATWTEANEGEQPPGEGE